MSLVNLEAYTAKRQEQEDVKRQEWQALGDKLKQQLPQDRFFGAAENAANSFATANTLAAQSPELHGAPTAKESDILEQNLYKESKPDDKALDVLYETQAKIEGHKANEALVNEYKQQRLDNQHDMVLQRFKNSLQTNPTVVAAQQVMLPMNSIYNVINDPTIAKNPAMMDEYQQAVKSALNSMRNSGEEERLKTYINTAGLSWDRINQYWTGNLNTLSPEEYQALTTHFNQMHKTIANEYGRVAKSIVDTSYQALPSSIKKDPERFSDANNFKEALKAQFTHTDATPVTVTKSTTGERPPLDSFFK